MTRNHGYCAIELSGLSFNHHHTCVTLSDWLRDSSLSGPHGANLEAGHYILGKECAAEVLGQRGRIRAQTWDPYSLKYTVRHITIAGQ